MNVFGIGLPEMAVIAAIALLVFGPKRLPELGKTLGRTLKGFQSASQGFEEQFRSALEPSQEAFPSAPSPTTAVSSTLVDPSPGSESRASGTDAATETNPAGGSSAS